MGTKIVFILCYISLINAKYLFPEHAIIFSHPQNLDKSYFGFTVQLQVLGSGNNRLIVGAPRSNDSTQENLIEPGAIFSCSLEGSSDSTLQCKQFELDSGNDEKFIRGKNNSCLGYSLDVSSNGGLLACAPKWINYYLKESLPLKMNGMCYYLKDSSNIQPTKIENLIPFNDSSLQYDRYSYNYIFGGTGFSSQLIDNGKTVIMTGLGLHNWTGSITQYNILNQEQEYKKFIVTRPKVRNLETYSYFGYYLASGCFNSSNPKKIFYVSGSPRSDNLTGMVTIYEQLTDFNVYTNRFTFPGQKFGEYFGASLAVADLNGDGIDDLVIGAPMHSTDDKDEIGHIYPYITKKYETSLGFQKDIVKYPGKRERGRFGTAISSLGDINKDGCDDIAVGAPYYDGGVVYIYLGQKGDIALIRWDQTIQASEYFPHMRGFGYSLSRGTDIDGNFNNDLAIGSYLSGHAVVIKSRPITQITQDLRADIAQVNISTTKFQITYCLKYVTKDIPDQLTIRTILISENPQIHIIENQENTIYTKNEKTCRVINVQITPDLTTDIKINARYDITNDKTIKGFCKECPIDVTRDKTKQLTIYFASGCGNRTCRPNLKISANFNVPGQSSGSLVLGSTNQVELKTKITNWGENSFGTQLEMRIINSSITFINYDKRCKEGDSNLNCSYSTLKSNEQIDTTFILNVKDLSITDKNLNITLLVRSNSEDVDLIDNNYNAILPITTDVKYNIITNSEPEQLTLYNNVTPSYFVHTYNIESIGQTALDYFFINIYIPLEYNEKNIASTRNIEISGCDSQRNEIITPAITDNISNEEVDKTINLNCTSTQTKSLKCVNYTCIIREDSNTKIERRTIEIRLLVDVPIFLEEANSVYFVTSLQTDSEYLNLKYYAKTNLIPIIKAANITLYVVIGIIIGIILFLILGLILYKCKFFKTKQIPMPEEEPIMEIKDNDEEQEEEGKTTTVQINQGGTSFEEQDMTKLKEEKY